MSTPMYDIPEHLPIKVNAQGQGPIDDSEPGHWTCWCGRSACMWGAAFEADRDEAKAEALREAAEAMPFGYSHAAALLRERAALLDGGDR